jgi:hypothetical protein
MARNGSRREKFALALAGGRTVTKAAAKAGIGRRTATRWLAEPAMRARVAELRSAMIARAIGRTAAGLALAAGRLRRLVRSKDERVALRAASALLAIGLRVNLDELVGAADRDAAPVAIEPMTQAEHVARLRELAEFIERQRSRLDAGGAAPAGVNGKGQGNHHSNGDANVDRRKS